MNELIERLAREAGIKFDPHFGTTYTGNAQVEAFAKLVARECINVVQLQYMTASMMANSREAGANNNAIARAEKAISERFGIVKADSESESAATR